MTSAVELTAGGTHNCALTTAGDLYCWGDNRNLQLGNGSVAVDTSTPVLSMALP